MESFYSKLLNWKSRDRKVQFILFKKNKNFQIGTCGFRDINFRKFLSQNQEKQ